MSKLNDIAAEKDKQLKQEEEMVAKLLNLAAETIDIAAEKDKQLKQEEEVVAKLRDLAAEG